jgi:hypothetical protein
MEHASGMADPVLTNFVRLTDWLLRMTTTVVVIDLVIALAARVLAPALDPIAYCTAAVSFVGSLPIFLRHLLGRRGLRDVRQRGFGSNRSALWYAVSFRGFDPKFLILAACALLILPPAGSVPDDALAYTLVALAAFWTAGVSAIYTRRWPADEEG